MTDFFDETFAGLDDYYPGSKRKRRTAETVKPKIDKDVWETRSFAKTLSNGTKVEMYTIQSLAIALGRPVATLRLWMKEGHLPSAPYRLPAKPDKNGNEKAGRRLYSKAMIEKAVEVFQMHGILTASRVEWTMHRQVTVDLAEAWNNIRASETTAN